mmetsp:Transcript_120784/g.210190  ORF Transcript_120784/g.210190 Transcript_120784/m.210190 type:complete len:420 (-) Transcript_120784:2555-3814(-)
MVHPESKAGYLYNPSLRSWKILTNWKYSQIPLIKFWLIWNTLVAGAFVAMHASLGNDHGAIIDFKATASQTFDLYKLFFPFVSIIGSFYTNVTYNRWWTIRDQLRIVMGGGIDASMHIAAECTRPDVRREMIRYISLAQAIVLFQFRTFYGDKDGDGDMDENDIQLFDEKTGEEFNSQEDWLQHLENRGTCTREEKEVIKKAAAPFHLPYEWFLCLLSSAAANGDLKNPIPTAIELGTKISTMRGGVTNILMHLSTPTPFPYFYSFRVITLATILLTPLAVAGIGPSSTATYALEVIASCIATFFVASLWSMAVLLADPFGFDVCDFPLEKEWAKSETLMMQQISAIEKHPGIPSLYHQGLPYATNSTSTVLKGVPASGVTYSYSPAGATTMAGAATVVNSPVGMMVPTSTPVIYPNLN